MNAEQGFWRKNADPSETVSEDAAPRSRRTWLIVAGAVILALLVGWYVYGKFAGGGTAATPPQSVPSVTYVTPGRQSVTNTVSATGNLAARREMPVGVSGEGGMVVRVLVEPGDWVRAGQTLALVDRAVQVQQSAQMIAQVSSAQADARLAQAELERAQALRGRGFISQADIDRRTATRDAANARVRVAQAQAGEMNARLGRLDIRAPAAGLVLSRAIEPGQIVSSGSGTLFRLAKDGQMELLARLSEQDLARMSVGLPADVTPVGTATSFAGQIWQLSPIIDPQTRQGVARIALDYNVALRPGGFAEARIRSGSVTAPLLPESAVQSDDKGNYVYVIAANDTVERRAVTIGETSDAGIAVLTGLSGTEKVVLSAGAFLNPGDKVKPVRATAQR